MEHVSRKRHERRQCWVCIREGDVESEDGGSIRPWVIVSGVLVQSSRLKAACVPLRTNMTPDQREGSPGVKLTNTPWGQDCLSPALETREPGQRSHVEVEDALWARTHNSARRFCRRKDGNIAIFSDAILLVCYIMMSMNMMGAETTVVYVMPSVRRLCKMYQVILLAGLFWGYRLTLPTTQSTNPLTQATLEAVPKIRCNL